MDEENKLRKMLFSIITVCHNSERYIRSAIESVLHQNYENIEYIIIDGKSNDSTIDIIQSYNPLFNGRLKWLSEKDSGIYDAMNKGISMATGDIIGILNSDDFYNTTDIISKIANCFKTENADAVYGDLLYVDAENTQKIQRYWKSGKYRKNAFKYGWMPPHPTFFVKKSVYDNYGKFKIEFKSAADYEFMLRVIHKGKIKVAYIPLTIVKMRTGGESNSSIKNRLRGNKEDLQAWKVNDLKPFFLIRFLKPVRKIFQYIRRPKN